tara:strand:- start:1 stop:330 length:330 start_codon:yes stop_codon:yes gene_type:complete
MIYNREKYNFNVGVLFGVIIGIGLCWFFLLSQGCIHLSDNIEENIESVLIDRIENLEKKYIEDSITIEILGSDYVELWEETQLFSSMFSEIENEPGGHEMLKTLYDKQR